MLEILDGEIFWVVWIFFFDNWKLLLDNIVVLLVFDRCLGFVCFLWIMLVGLMVDMFLFDIMSKGVWDDDCYSSLVSSLCLVYVKNR